MRTVLEEVNNAHPEWEVLISGGAQGADSLAVKVARRVFKQVKLDIRRPEWKRYGKRAGVLRNLEMLERADAVVAFWDGKSPGTKQMIEATQRKRTPIQIIRYDDLRGFATSPNEELPFVPVQPSGRTCPESSVYHQRPMCPIQLPTLVGDGNRCGGDDHGNLPPPPG